MRLNYLYKFMVLFSILFTVNAQADPCISWNGFSLREGVATSIARTESVHLNKVETNGNLYVADPIDIEFWIEQCVNGNIIGYSLFATVTPIVPGKSRAAIFYDIAVIQNNQQFDGLLNYSDNLFVPSDFWTMFATVYSSSSIITSIPSGIDLSQPFTLIFSCNNSWPYYEECNAVNPASFFEINPQPVSENPTISSVNGAWFDPEYNGSGFNMVQTPFGFLMFFYGYKEDSNGETLWMISSAGPTTINKGETFTLDMLSGFPGNGGSLDTRPTTQNSGTIKWGTAEITFNTCDSGVIKLIKNNGTSITHNIGTLGSIDGLTCRD